MKYKIVRYEHGKAHNNTDEFLGKDEFLKRFEDLVSEHLNKGWSCQGSPSTKYFTNNISNFYEQCSFEQAMVKE